MSRIVTLRLRSLPAVLLLALLPACILDDGGSGGGRGWRWEIPSGSYRDSCRDIQVDGNRLSARCQDSDGDWVRSSLDLRRCDSDIRNVEGQLKCSRDLDYGLPRGSYSRSCRDVRVERDVLKATCTTREGRSRKTSLRLDGCDSTVSNDDGRLVCDD